jgi:hypothetical protein
MYFVVIELDFLTFRRNAKASKTLRAETIEFHFRLLGIDNQ